MCLSNRLVACEESSQPSLRLANTHPHGVKRLGKTASVACITGGRSGVASATVLTGHWVLRCPK